MRCAEQPPGGQGHGQGAQIEAAEHRQLRRLLFLPCQQYLVAHLTQGEADVGTLHHQEAQHVAFGQPVEADDGRPQHRQQCSPQIDRLEAPLQQIVDQGDVDGGEDGEHQHFRHRQQQEGVVIEQIHDAELGGTEGHQLGHQVGPQPAAAQEGQEHQAGEHDAGQHREVGIHLAGEIDPDQAEGE